VLKRTLIIIDIGDSIAEVWALRTLSPMNTSQSISSLRLIACKVWASFLGVGAVELRPDVLSQKFFGKCAEEERQVLRSPPANSTPKSRDRSLGTPKLKNARSPVHSDDSRCFVMNLGDWTLAEVA
jgi:hypothetical protein